MSISIDDQNSMKILQKLHMDREVKFKESLSMSLNAGTPKDGGSRIPVFSRRASTTDFSSSLNKSFDSRIPTQGSKQKRPPSIKRHHSIYERGEKESIKVEKHDIDNGRLSPNLSATRSMTPRSKSPVQQRKGLNPAAIKRHKSFSGGERINLLKPNPSPTSLRADSSLLRADSSSLRADSAISPDIRPPPGSLKRRNTYHTLEIAKREGIVNMKSAKISATNDPGRVQVFVRIRPLNDSEDINKHPLAVTIEDEDSTQLKVLDGKNDRCYQFDGVLPDEATNKEVYKTVGEPLVYSALSGFNGILMCYGQTGTGKTYTLMSNDGISVRVIYQCFKVINSDHNHKYTVTCSYLQIYQEKIYDLLNETRTVELSLREHPKTGVYIENLTEYVVHTPKEVLNLLRVGKRRLVFAETKMNRASSRSHAICQLKVLKERKGTSDTASNSSSSPPLYGMKTPDSIEDDDLYDDNMSSSMNSSYQSLVDDDDEEDILSNVTQLEDGVTSVRGKIYICDLAGSERIKKTKASGERLSEAQHINSSLLELGNVIQALAEGNNRLHVPFRNSTLTRLLQEGLSGNCKTRLVVCIAPTIKDVHETKCSLNFGSRAMKVQVMAHVNYEVDYKKLAEALAAKLEALENEWNIKKKEYEKFINQLKYEVGSRRLGSPMDSSFTGVNRPPAKHVKSLLVVELMTLQLFYNLQSRLRHSTANQSNALNFTTSNQDMMLQSMEGLLELLNECIRDQSSYRSKNYSNLSTSSGTSSVITSPDYIDTSVDFDMPSTLEPVSRFLEHAQITSSNYQGGTQHKPYLRDNENLVPNERYKLVMNTLMQLKETISRQAVKHLKDTFETSIQDGDKSLLQTSNLSEIVAILDSQKELLSTFNSMDDIHALENTLYYLQIDKALLSCMVLLKIQSGDKLSDMQNVIPSNSVSGNLDDFEIKRIIDDLTSERNMKEKLKDELYTLQEQYMMSEEKLKDIELELQTVRELKNKLETKLHQYEDKNLELQEEIEKLKHEKGNIESRLSEIEKKKIFLEASLKTSDNNNARKERIIVDLKNEKVALDSLVSTLKEEISILEKEKTRDTDERRHIEEELEDLRDRNIILETEWSCCREENGLLETELTALEEDKALLEDEILKYREDVRMLEEAVTVLEAQAADYKQDILNLKTKEDRLLVNVRSEKDKFNKEMNQLRQEMSTLRVEKRRFQRDISMSRADKANTERAYNSLKVQKDSLQGDVSSFKQEEKRLQREISNLKNDRAKLEREVNVLKNENTKLKQELVLVDKLKLDFKLLQKNEEKISAIFNCEKDKLLEQLTGFKEKFQLMENDYTKICQEKEKLVKQLKRYESHKESNDANIVRRSQSQPAKASTPDKVGKMKACSSVQGALVRRSVHSGEVSEVEGKVLDLQRRLAFFMAEKEDIQKELITTRERNSKLTSELKYLEEDTSKIQLLLSTLADEKETLQSKLSKISSNKALLDKERDELKEAVKTAQEISSTLQNQLDELTEQNRVMEVDHLTVRESVTILQNETVILKNENKHIKTEFKKVDFELKTTKSTVESLSEKLTELKRQVTDANNKEKELKEMLLLLEGENCSLSDQVKVCHEEEESLVNQLLELSLKVNQLESEVEQDLKDEATSTQALQKVEELTERNLTLETSLYNLKIQLSTLVTDAKQLKDEREAIEKILQDEVANNKDGSENKTLIETIREFKIQLLKVKEEKYEIEDKLKLVESQMKSLDQINTSLQQNIGEKSNRLEQEKSTYKVHIDNLQHQIEDLVKERMQLEAEVLFLKQQNAELRREIAMILADNDSLEQELNHIQLSYDEQENELDSATEETKVLLRQLCAAETQNLNLCTLQSSHQDDVEDYKSQVQTLQKEKAQMGEEKFFSDVQSTTLKERLIMAELEISQLKTEHATVESQRRLLIEDLETADRERSVLKTELKGLARALSPLKKEVTEVVKRQENLQNEVNQNTESNVDISKELLRAKEDLSAFHVEKKTLENEQIQLERKLKSLGKEKDDVRSQLRYLIQDLDVSNAYSSKNNLTEMEESIHILSELISQKDDLKQEHLILDDDLDDSNYKNQILNICVDTSHSALKSTQEELCLATVERLKLKDKTRQMDKKVTELQEGEYRSGLTPLQLEVNRLKNDIENFETSQEHLLHEVRSLNEQLNTADHNLENVLQFKTIIENNLKQYKERNTKLEAQLKIIYNDLIEMEAHCHNEIKDTKKKAISKINSNSNTSKPPTKGAKLLLETLDLHKHFQLLEDDLKSTEYKHRSLKEDAADLLERCSALEEEKELSAVSKDYIHESISGKNRYVTRLQKEKETLSYDKQRLQTKLTLYKNDKKRILEDFQRLNKSLAAYARYNQELEKKLLSFKVDFSELENKSDIIIQQKRHHDVTHTSEALCDNCQENISRKFLGVNKNTQLLGDELLDCITDNMSLETAIFTFMADKSKLEHELISMESNQRDMENLLYSQNDSNRDSSLLRWSGSQLSIDSDISKR